MAKPKTNFTELIHQTVREAPGALTIDEIATRVLELSGGDSTKNLKNTIRAAITQSTAIIYTPERGYGWKCRLLNGVVQRIVLHEEGMAERELEIDDLQRDLLQPNGPGVHKYGVAGLPRIELAGGPTIETGSIPRPFDDDLLSMPEAFWEWLGRQGARPGDSLLLTAIDIEARRYSLSHEPAAARDEQAIAARGEQVVEAALSYVRRTRASSTIWEMSGHLNASGIFHQIPAPPPFSDLWTIGIWGPLIDEYDVSPVMLGGSRASLDYLDMMLGGAPIGLGVRRPERAGRPRRGADHHPRRPRQLPGRPWRRPAAATGPHRRDPQAPRRPRPRG